MVREEAIFENEIRKMIYNHIVAYPGVSFRTLLGIFELTEGGLRYHIDYLEKNNKVFKKLENGKKSYYPRFEITRMNKKFSGNNGPGKLTTTQTRILDLIKMYPGINQKDLVYRLRSNPSQVSRNLKVLKKMGFVKDIKIEKNVCYQLTPDNEMKAKIINEIIVKLINNEIDEETFFKIVKALE
jgi:predicted transcriptional regulator